MLFKEVFIDQAQRRDAEVYGLDINVWYTVFNRRCGRQCTRLDTGVLDHPGQDREALFARVRNGVNGRLLFHQAFSHQPAGKAAQLAGGLQFRIHKRGHSIFA